MNKKVTKRALFLSFVSMFLCFTMLLGTTYAWFTDSVASGVNTIVAGNLDVELYHTNETVTNEQVGETIVLFDKVDKWEPGAMVWEKFTIENKGDLALKYQFSLNAENATVVVDPATNASVSFADMLKIAVITDETFVASRDSIKALDASQWSSLASFVKAGELATNGETDVYTVVIYWMPSDQDNLFNFNNGTQGVVSVDLGVNLFATQLVAENDSFGNDYDDEASFPKQSESVALDGTATENVVLATDTVEVALPADAANALAGKSVAIAYTEPVVKDGAVKFGEIEVVNTADGTVVDLAALNTSVTVTLNVGDAFNVGDTVSVYHDDEFVATTTVDANKNISYTAAHFCEVVVAAEASIGTKSYATVEAAFAAAVDGDVIVLKSDAEVDADTTITVAKGKTLTLDLNGKTLVGVSDQTGSNRNMFDVRGTLTVKNGTVTIEHKGTNMGWGSSTNVFNVTDGGVLNVDNATVKNLGGSDMAFCAHLNNWGEVTLNVTNSTLESTYVAVRVFNSGNDDNNVTIKNSTLAGTNYAFWVHNYTAVDFGTQDKADVQKELLNFDIFNGTNTFVSATKPETPIRYGFTNSVLAAANGKETVEVSTADELKAALAAGKNVTLMNDISVDVNTTAPYGNAYGIKVDGVTLDGQGYALNFNNLKNNQSSYDNYGIMTTGGTIKNVTVTGVFRGIVTMSPTSTLYIDNVVVADEDVCYAINTTEYATVEGVKIVVANSTIGGWSSFAGLDSISFTNCKFVQGKYYTDVYGRLVKPYVNATFENCEFESKYYIDLSALGANQTVTLENCTVNGVKLTTDNMADIIVAEDACGEGQITIESKAGTYNYDDWKDYVVIK